VNIPTSARGRNCIPKGRLQLVFNAELLVYFVNIVFCQLNKTLLGSKVELYSLGMRSLDYSKIQDPSEGTGGDWLMTGSAITRDARVTRARSHGVMPS